VAVFGQKDAQQVTLIEKMVDELNLPLRIVRCPTERETDGLAMSSRNTYLSASERSHAPQLYAALLATREALRGGSFADAAQARLFLNEQLKRCPAFQVDYAEVVHRRSLTPPDTLTEGTLLLAAAVKIGKTRLIDNLEA
jgi:pantoate--beta-alanine ligase